MQKPRIFRKDKNDVFIRQDIFSGHNIILFFIGDNSGSSRLYNNVVYAC